jgi:MFS family permease
MSFLFYTISFLQDDKYIFILLGIIGRFLQGIAIGGISTICYSYIPILYAHQINKIISYYELATCIGIAAGPNFEVLLSKFFSNDVSVFLFVTIFYLTYSFFFMPFIIKD